ncbi:uncharacterized protein MONOS_5854 [Monocercomonoides exilis]|uniref:uncharacterized protein n=1 Tax=Monocercomonoides exilis TaxID=2049356 RepID=UPI00355982EA|nr:hypothetical protein MONOS_5854 [Monocercomonoides exilis]|eukprot:MONOS_5854.1-p1 / transcript=MONOS_5854.1 / gene=MONOS_5854 / organism=Monocercomonoides_exilis_PA203 / gene_product=unspecified product / transcript_product=unspecified product / location=Mono_scaffold00176:30710-31123(+) / protein_length=138 / sequence_SO=supercontig / SO=protein_coding / is_pseudo=false
MHQVVTKKTWRIEASSDAWDTICKEAASEEKIVVSKTIKMKNMKNIVMGEGMEGAQNRKIIFFLWETTTVELNEETMEGKRRRVVISTEVIAGKGQSITVVTTADESEEAKVMDADQVCVTEEGKLREKKKEEEKDD